MKAIVKLTGVTIDVTKEEYKEWPYMELYVSSSGYRYRAEELDFRYEPFDYSNATIVQKGYAEPKVNPIDYWYQKYIKEKAKNEQMMKDAVETVIDGDKVKILIISEE